jgi:hypothetical protein
MEWDVSSGLSPPAAAGVTLDRFCKAVKGFNRSRTLPSEPRLVLNRARLPLAKKFNGRRISGGGLLLATEGNAFQLHAEGSLLLM